MPLPVPSELSPVPLRHSRLEDVYALLIGCALIVIGLICLRTAGLVTGGIAGVALLLSYIVPLPPGLLFTLINLPFFLFARAAMGTGFMLKTMVVSAGVTAMSLVAPYLIQLAHINQLFAALFGGTIVGLGVLVLARHDAGVGGTGVMTLWFYKKRGWNAGRTQLCFDVCILSVALLAMPPMKVLLSALSSAAISGVLIAFHRPGRYTGY